MAMIKVEDLLKECREKDITISEEQKKFLEGKSEVSEEELENVAGGVCYPDNPPCEYCGSNNTWTEWHDVRKYAVHCRSCGHVYVVKY